MAALLDHLRQLEAELHHPGVHCSRGRLEELLHPDFHEVGRSGRRYTRAVVIDHLAARSSPPAVEATDHALDRVSESCALLTYRSMQRSADGTVEAALRSSLWVRTARGWQLFYHQGTPTPA